MTRFRLGKRGFTYRLSEAARVTITIERRVGKGKRKRWKKVKTLRARERKGKQGTAFIARKLALGAYRARIVARDSKGKRSAEHRLTWRVVKRNR